MILAKVDWTSVDWAGLAWAHLWQLTLVAIAVGLIARLLLRHRPHLAYLLWMLVIIKAVVPPVVGSPTGLFSWALRERPQIAAIEPVAEQTQTNSSSDASQQGEGPLTHTQEIAPLKYMSQGTEDQASVGVTRLMPSAGSVLAIVWATGAGIVAMFVLAKWISFRRRWRSGAVPVPTHLRQQIDELAERLGLSGSSRRRLYVLVSHAADSPAVFGVWRPTLLLPARLLPVNVAVLATESGPDKTHDVRATALPTILAHELIHIRRGDTLAAMLQLLAQMLWWFHPLIWWANRETRRERERSCDEETVVGLGCSPRAYARVLLDVLEAQTRHPPTLALPGVGMLGITAARMEHLLRRPGSFHHRTPRAFFAVVIVALLVLLPGAGLQSASPDAAPQSASQVAVKDTSAGDRGDESNDQLFVDTVSDRVAAAIQKQQLSFVGPKELAALRKELHDYLVKRVTLPQKPVDSTAILAAVDEQVARDLKTKDVYRSFRAKFDMIKWQLWTTLDRSKLTPDEVKLRDEQRQWMREYISSIPMTEFDQRAFKGSYDQPLATLEYEILNNPISPIFYEPMSAAEFDDFKQNILKRRENLQTAPARLFQAGVWARAAAVLNRWPPDFPTGSKSASQTRDFSFRGKVFPNDTLASLGIESHDQLFDIAKDHYIHRPTSKDEASTALWLSETKEGDLWYDAKTTQILAVRGATLTTIPETEWDVIDRLTMSDLRKRLAASPMNAYSMAGLDRNARPNIDVKQRDMEIKTLPTLVVRTGDGLIAVMRIEDYTPKSVMLRVRLRPLPPYLPFHPGDPEYIVAKTPDGHERSVEKHGPIDPAPSKATQLTFEPDVAAPQENVKLHGGSVRVEGEKAQPPINSTTEATKEPKVSTPSKAVLALRARTKLAFEIDCGFDGMMAVTVDKEERYLIVGGNLRPKGEGSDAFSDWAEGKGRGVIDLWDLQERKKIKRFEGEYGAVLGAAFSPDAKLLATAGRKSNDALGGHVLLWDVETGKPRESFKYVPTPVKEGTQMWQVATAFSPDGSLLAAGGFDRSPIIWSMATAKEVERLPWQPSFTDHLFFTPDNSRLIVPSRRGDVTVWDTKNWKSVRELKVENMFLLGAALSPDGKTLAVGGEVTSQDESGVQAIISAKSGDKQDGEKEKASPLPKGQVTVWDLASGKILAEFKLDGIASGLSFSPDGKLLAATGMSEDLTIWEWAKKEVYALIPQPLRGSGDKVEFLPRSGRLMLNSHSKKVLFYDLK